MVKEAHSSILQETLVEGINFTVQSSIQEEQKYFDEAIEELEEKIDDIELPNDSYEVVQNRYDLLIHERDSIEQEYMYIVEQTAKNAQLVPFEIREKAEVLLESYQPKFKVGLFRNVKKINDERHQRLLDFYATLKEKVESSLEWKLRDKVTEFLSSYLAVNLTDAVFEQNFKPEDFLSLMEDGATVNGEYLLVYTDQVAASVKKLYRQYYKNKWQEVQNNVLNPIEEKIKENKLYVARYQRFNEIQIEIKKYKNKFIDYKNELEAINNRESIGNEQAISLIDKKLEERKVDRMIDVSAIIVNNNIEKKEIVNKKEEASTTSLLSYKQTLMDANKAQQLIEPITSLDSIRQEIGQKKERLTDRHFTIALFGAFSAGKSSFANALIGEKILPVSPNPTTAAINKISPVRTGYRHKEVLVIFKQEQELLADINDITEKDFQFLNDAYSWIKKTKLAKLDIPDQHRSFLAALYQGYSEMKESIGLSYVVGFEDFQRYIRDETIACFVKEMELFYDCPLTKNHITLVDTPGADSVNARHTDLAFSYIKDADAILFVTYFNHPFSKPDQQFLERLGSVKDAFELDKMFFMINAIDLAKNEQEETMVVDYVRSELQRFDIKDPQIFPVSSKQAVEHKDEHTGLPQFEENFYRFVKEELAQMSMRSIYIDLARANSLVSSWLSMINSDQQEKERLIEKNKQNKLEIETKIEQRKNKIYFDMVAQKLTKQSFYAKQRFMIQFTDLWKDHIHPGAIQSSGKNGKKQLENALDKLFKTISVRSKHEYEAIVIRIEQSWNQAMQTMKTDMDRQLKEIDTVFSLSQYEDIQFMPPEIDLQEIHADQSLVSKWTQTYKDTKSFFADNVRKQLEEQVSDYLIARWQELISQMEQDLMKFYQSQWHDYEQKVWDNYLVEVDNYYRQVIDGIADQEKNKDQLENIHHYLEEVLADKKIG
ncbi:uncharacterized protein Bsub YpbR [Gracilibacillus boraciitolerans JCM 21714]|uniref:Uncharacterized protein Bsub YpbR n=1 Tax=Gracilibacillus boraciitolerans JCM 21714 TaxID=1298598 RepID=W4VFB0_9BACI|nr:uncharacterized protein Bsub YpbR [Gracilibacillus boraciitolerans JCM 21714]